MKLKTIILSLATFIFFATTVSAQLPEKWQSRGVGGGGGLFSPSINPTNSKEYFLSCDMGEIFHTNDFGLSYTQLDFRYIQSSGKSKILFTKDSDMLYCIGNSFGNHILLKSTDKGITWQKNEALKETIYRVFVDYDNPNIVVANYYSSVLISLDGGESFNTIHKTTIGAGAHLAGVFFDYPNIFIGLNEGLFVSHDGGKSFEFENNNGMPKSQAMYSFVGAKQNDTIRFITTTINSAKFTNSASVIGCAKLVEYVFKMDYKLSEWTNISSNINFKKDYPAILAMAENNIHTAYIGGIDDGSFPIVLKTNDGGNSWEHSFLTIDNKNIYTAWAGYKGDRNWWFPGYILGIDVLRSNADTIVVTDMMTVHKSGDGGKTWQQAYTNPKHQHPTGALSPKKQNYSSIGIENTGAWSMVWNDGKNIFVGFTDISGIRSKDGGNEWNFDYTGHEQNTMYCVEKHPVNGYLYAATSTVHDIYQTTKLNEAQIEYSGATGKIIFSKDGGVNWKNLYDFGKPVYYLAIDPKNPQTMYASVISYSATDKGGIWKTENLYEGENAKWTKLPNPPRTEGHPANIIVLNDGNVLTTWSARRNPSGGFTASSGVFLYNPQNNSWQDLSHKNMYYWTKDIVLDPKDDKQNTWYACVWSGWGGVANDKGGLYRTENRGITWKQIWATHRVESCTFNPKNDNQLFATTEWQGLWVSDNIRSNEPKFENVKNYDFMHPLRVFFNPYDLSEMWVTSFGNGLKTAKLIPTSIECSENDNMQLYQNYPNPFNISTTITWEIDIDGYVTVEIYELIGRKIRTLINEYQKAGKYGIDFNGLNLPSGVYYYQIQIGNSKTMKKLMIKN